jgi:hypothetical protein
MHSLKKTSALVLLILWMVFPSCNTDRTAENKRLTLVSRSFQDPQLSSKQKDVQLNTIHLNYPKFLSKPFNSLILNLVKKDTIGVFCAEQEYLDISYKVEHYSKSLLCMSKFVKVTCPMGNKDFQFKEVQTYFLKNDSIFTVTFEPHADFKRNITSRLENRIQRRCTKPDLNRIDIVLRKGSFFVHVPYDYPLCDTLMPFTFGKNTVKVKSLIPVK